MNLLSQTVIAFRSRRPPMAVSLRSLARDIPVEPLNLMCRWVRSPVTGRPMCVWVSSDGISGETEAPAYLRRAS